MLKAYILLAALLASAASFTAGHLEGRKSERGLWELRAAREARDAAHVLAGSLAQARAYERAQSDLKDQIERNSLDADAKITAAHNTNALLLASLDGLRDRAGSGVCRENRVPGNAEPAASVAESTAGGCRLSGATSQALLDLAALADRTAVYAKACHAWIQARSKTSAGD